MNSNPIQIAEQKHTHTAHDRLTLHLLRFCVQTIRHAISISGQTFGATAKQMNIHSTKFICTS